MKTLKFKMHYTTDDWIQLTVILDTVYIDDFSASSPDILRKMIEMVFKDFVYPNSFKTFMYECYSSDPKASIFIAAGFEYILDNLGYSFDFAPYMFGQEFFKSTF